MLFEKDKQILEMKNNNMLLDDKNNLLNQKYVEIEKNKYIYLFSTDKSNIYKCGMTKNIKDRKDSLQTGNVDDIITLHECKTSNGKLLEQIVHDILHKYRCDNGREHFLVI